MSNLSLLVDCGKIIKWLEQRKKLPKDWYNYVKAAEQKLKVLLKQHESFAKYQQLHTYLVQNIQTFCFYDLIQSIQKLLQTDIAQEKSLIFGYNDKRVKQWTNLKKFMESKNLGMLNNAKFIEQSLKFDLPGLSKNVEMIDNQLANLKRKIDFNFNTIYQQQKQMKKQINTVGLEIDFVSNFKDFNIESQIPIIIGKVPATIEQIQKFVSEKNIKKLVNIYKQKVEKDGLTCEVPLLEYFLENKNDYLDVYKGVERSSYVNVHKYRQFFRWRPVNEWEITMEGYDQASIQVLLNETTLIQDRQIRQELLCQLNEVMYYFIGLKYECAKGTNKLKSNDQLNMTQNQLQNAIIIISSLNALLASKKLLTPLQLKNNKKSYQHFITKFHNIQKNIRTLQDQINDYRKQIENLQLQRNIQVQKLRTLRKKIISVKKMQQKLLTQFIGKQVKIVGEINKIQ